MTPFLVMNNVEEKKLPKKVYLFPVSYTHLRAHETPEHLVCRLLLEKKKLQKGVFVSDQRKKP